VHAGRYSQCSGGRVVREETEGDALRFRRLVEVSADAFVETDTSGVVTAWSARAEELFGWSADDVLGRRASEFWVPARFVDRYLADLASAVPGQRVPTREIRLLTRSGEEMQAAVSVYVVEIDGERRVGGFVRDIGAERAAEEALAHAYLHDPLTGLPNRTLFTYRLAYALARGQREPGSVAVLVLDLDRFKAINDALGHEVGDEVLVEVAGRLVRADGTAEVIARLGGDDFLVLFDGDGAESAAVAFSERVLGALAQPIAAGGSEVYVTASIGIAATDGSPTDATPLLSNADSAMYQAKQRGGSAYHVFGEALRVEVIDRLTTEHALHRALDRGELCLHYQPVVDVASEQPVAVEALLRWEHPEQGLVGPNRFIPVAEESGLIIPIGTWVIDQACRQLRSWRSAAGVAVDAVEVNLSARQVDHLDLVATVEEIVRTTGIPPARLTLEITESALMKDAAAALSVLRALKELGCTLAIDDFGTGYSSLSYLQRFPLDILKVDKSFVDNLGSDPGGVAIVGAVVSLAHSLGLRVIAEGVETAQQLEQLRALGCDLAQGYLFSPPVPASLLFGDALATGGAVPA